MELRNCSNSVGLSSTVAFILGLYLYFDIRQFVVTRSLELLLLVVETFPMFSLRCYIGLMFDFFPCPTQYRAIQSDSAFSG